MLAKTAPPPKAPWLQPGVVVHDPAFPVDGLLADFALEVRRRGFSVQGFVQRNNRPGEGCAPRIELLNLSDGSMVEMTRSPCSGDGGAAQATETLRRALTSGADLVVVGRFAALARAADGLGDAVRDGMSAGFPVLTSVAGKCMSKWNAFSGRDGALLSPDAASLWRWWGPDRLYPDLVHGVADSAVRRIVVGPRWLFVQGDHGSGIANLPRGGEGIQRQLADYQRRGLPGLAALAHSWDPVERALAVAAINAGINRRDLVAGNGDGLDELGQTDGRVVLVGAFPGYRERMPGARMVESNPRDGEFPIAAAECLLPGCASTILSSACLVNRTLPRMLSLAAGARAALAGPATPLTPRLHAYGLDVLSGFVITNPNGMADAVARGAKPWAFAPFGRVVHLRRT